ncbi:hypothetical protein HDU93_003658 [Gonapodya sp. JEL0774]|nr:hypothetical protein HDU93_003658 [Gonapodya sp. JEL0774]
MITDSDNPTNLHVFVRKSRPTDLVMEAQFDGATSDELYQCFTNDAIGTKLWGDYTIELTPGGKLGGAKGTFSGQVIAFEAPKYLSFTFSMNPSDTKNPPVCTFIFDEYRRGSRSGASVTLVKSGITAEEKDVLAKGWEDWWFIPFAKHLQTPRKRPSMDEPPTNGVKKAKTDQDTNANGVSEEVPELAKQGIGRPCHWDIPVKDMSRASKFYTSALGWHVTSWMDNYALFNPNAEGKKEGKQFLAGGLFLVSADTHIAPGMEVYLAVESIDAAIGKVVKAGGKQLGKKELVKGDPGGGKHMLFEDTEGNAHYLYEFASPESYTSWSQPHPQDGAFACHIEIPAQDEERFERFYKKLFGWSFGKMPGGYTWWAWKGVSGAPGLPPLEPAGGLIKPKSVDPPAHLARPVRGKKNGSGSPAGTAKETSQRLFVLVDDIEGWEKKVKEEGGEVIKPVFLIHETVMRELGGGNAAKSREAPFPRPGYPLPSTMITDSDNPANLHVFVRKSRPTDLVMEAQFDGSTSDECFTNDAIGTKLWGDYTIELTPGGKLGGAKGTFSGQVIAFEAPKYLSFTFCMNPSDTKNPPVCTFIFDEYRRGSRSGASVTLVKSGITAEKKDVLAKGWEDWWFIPFAKYLQTPRKRPSTEEPTTNGFKKAKTDQDTNANGVSEEVPELAKQGIGRPCHWEIPVKNMSRASKFYTSALGWRVTSWMDNYALFNPNAEGKKEGKQFLEGGLFLVSADTHISPGMEVYLAVESIDVAIGKVVKAGGKQLGKKELVKGDPGGGKQLFFEDTEGNVHRLYEFSTPEMYKDFTKPDPRDGVFVCNIQIPAKDSDRFEKFYSKLFGWSFGKLMDGEYTWWTWKGVSTVPGLPPLQPVGGLMKPKDPPRPARGNAGAGQGQNVASQRLFLLVDDIDGWEKKVKEEGGEVIKPVFLIDETDSDNPANLHVFVRKSRPTDLVMEAQFDGATSDELYQCFTNDAIGTKLWGDYTIELTPGGKLGGAKGTFSGQVIAFEAPKYLSFTFSMNPSDTKTPPVCTFIFDEYRRGSRSGASVTLVKSGITAEEKDMFAKGWEDWWFIPFAKHLQSPRKRPSPGIDEPETAGAATNGAKKAKSDQDLTRTGDASGESSSEEVPELAKQGIGRPCHWEIPVKDMSRASKFYTSALGWRVTPWADEYALFSPNAQGKKEGKQFLEGGLYLVDPDTQVVSNLEAYLAVASIDEAIGKVVKAGGKKRGEKQLVIGDPGGGKELLFEDTEGNEHYFYEFRDPDLYTSWCQPHPHDGVFVCHMEIRTRDEEQFERFYGKLFGWSFGKLPGDFTFWAWKGVAKAPGLPPLDMAGGLSKPKSAAPPAHTVRPAAQGKKNGSGSGTGTDKVASQRLFLQVEDIEGWEKKVVEEGGEVVKAATLIAEGVGWNSQCRDFEGNELWLYKAAPRGEDK